MPVLPTIEQQGSLNTRTATPNDFGAGSALATASAANQFTQKAIGYLADKQNKAKQMQAINERTEIQKMLNDYQIQYSKNLESRKQDFDSTGDIIKTQEESINALTEQLGEKFQSDEAKLFISERVQSLRNRVINQSIREQTQFKRDKLISESTDQRNEIINQVDRGAMSPEMALDILDESADSLSAYSSQAAKALKQDNIDAIAPYTIKNLDPKTALETIDSSAFDKVTPRVREQIKKRVIDGAAIEYQSIAEDMQSALNNGFTYGDVRSEIKEARSLGLKNVADALSQMQSIQDKTVSFSGKSFNDQFQKISEVQSRIKSGRPKKEDILELSTYQSIIQAKQKALQERPYEYLKQTDQLNGEQFKSIQFDDPESAFDALEQRRVLQAQQFQKEGVQLPLLTRSEVDQLSTVFKSADPETSITLMANLSQYLKDDERLAVASQFGAKDPSIAFGFINAQYDQESVLMAIQGAKRDVGRVTDFDAFYSNIASNSITDPDAANSAKSVVKNMVKEQLFRAGETGETASDLESMIESSFERVVGPVIEINDKKTISFRDSQGVYLDADQFAQKLQRIDNEDILQAQGDVPRDARGKELDFQNLMDYSGLEAVGDGLYRIITQAGEFAVDSTGQPFELNMKKIKDEEINTQYTPTEQNLSVVPLF